MGNATTGDLSGALHEDEGKKGGLLGRFSAKLQDAVQQGRADDTLRKPVDNLSKEAALPADDVAIRQGQSIVLQRMIVPEGVVI